MLCAMAMITFADYVSDCIFSLGFEVFALPRESYTFFVVMEIVLKMVVEYIFGVHDRPQSIQMGQAGLLWHHF